MACLAETDSLELLPAVDRLYVPEMVYGELEKTASRPGWPTSGANRAEADANRARPTIRTPESAENSPFYSRHSSLRSERAMTPIDITALFLGPKSENRQYFKEMLEFLMDEHIHWRRDFHPEDPRIIGLYDRRNRAHQETLERTTESLLELSAKLKTSSMPWFSPRYLGHMNADTLLAANLAYMATILYNPNNVAYESAPATTEFELEVGEQFARLFGYRADRAWGHVTADGTVANYEGLWIARNLASVPHAVRTVRPDLLDTRDEWELSNMPTDEILDVLTAAREAGVSEEVRQHTVRGTGTGDGLGTVHVPESRHYSLAKAVDLLGIGRDRLTPVEVDADYRMDVGHLQSTIDDLVEDGTPILAVVPNAGSTEEGAVDPIHDVVALRDDYAEQGVSFYVHVDAAYGGYARTAFVDGGEFVEFDRMREELDELGVIDRETDWPSRHVYEAFRAFPRADSITVDPHKMGYVPYAAGGFVVRDKRALDVISYSAPYILDKQEEMSARLGSYILEGSKPGATAAAVWVAHRVLPLSMAGYGQLIGQGIEGAHRFYDSLASTDEIAVDGGTFSVRPLTRPDINIVDFAFNEVDNEDLQAMNNLNHVLYERSSYQGGPVYTKDFITSKTTLDAETYGDVPGEFAADLGIPGEEWDGVGEVTVLRSCVLTPYLAHETTYGTYWNAFMATMRETLAEIAAGD